MSETTSETASTTTGGCRWEDESIAEDVRLTTYVFVHPLTVSHRRNIPPVLVVLIPTSNGWRSRSTSKSLFNHDYVSQETLEDVLGWLTMESKRPFATHDREEAMAALAAPCESWAFPRTGFLVCNSAMYPEMRADVVLQHLECY